MTLLLTAAVEHGPGIHGGVVAMVLFAIAVVAGLAYLAWKGRGRSGG